MNLFGYKIIKQKRVDAEFFNRNAIYKYFFNCKEKIVAFDVGANTGQTTSELMFNFENISVHAFEPNSVAFDKLYNLYSMNRKVVLNKLALGEKSGFLELNCYSYSAYSSFYKIDPESFIFKKQIYKKAQNCADELYSPKKETVNIDTLDGYCSNNAIDCIDILKIDVQGYEENVLLGGLNLLKANSVKLIIMEITFDDYYSHSTSFFDIESILLKQNYVFWDISHIYKDLKRGRTCWVDAIYVNRDFLKTRLSEED